MRTLAQHNDYVEDILRWEQAITQVTNSKGKLHCEQLLATLKDKIKNIERKGHFSRRFIEGNFTQFLNTPDH